VSFELIPKRRFRLLGPLGFFVGIPFCACAAGDRLEPLLPGLGVLLLLLGLVWFFFGRRR
jgi:hypothetical protein